MWKNRWLAGIVGLALLAACGEEHKDHEHGEEGHKAKGEDHGHASPHDGVVKSIGDYHVELVSGDEGALTLYVLGTDEKSPHPISASSLTAQAQVKGQSAFTAVTLNASPLANESGGRSSRFTGSLPEKLHGKELNLTVKVSIDGKPYRAQFEMGEAHEGGGEHKEHEEHEEHDDD